MALISFIKLGKSAAMALALICAVPVMAATDTAPAIQPAQQMPDPLLEQLQRQTQEAETRAAEAERRERDAELKRLENEAAEAKARADEAERRASDAEHKQFVLEAKSDLENKAYARLEIIISLVGVFFGALVTIIVVFFALRTERAAIAAAKEGVQEIIKDFEEKRMEAVLAASEFKTLKDEINSFKSSMQSSEAPKSEKELKTNEEAAIAALAKPIRDRSADEFRAILTDLRTQEKWTDILMAAQQMRLLHEGDDDFAFACFTEAYALVQLNRTEEAVAVYDDVIKRFGDSKESALQDQVAKALVSKGFALGRLGRSEEEIAVYNNVIKRFGDSKELALQEGVAMALVNKGASLGQLNRSEEAIAAADEVIKRYGDSTEPELQGVVGRARKLKALIQGLQKK